MKHPWMPLFWGDFLANTMDLSAQEAGAYLFLIAHAWEHDGQIPADRIRLARIAHVRADQWNRVWKGIKKFFMLTSSITPSDVTPSQCYTHSRVIEELQRLEQISNKRKDANRQMRSKSPANAGAYAGAKAPLSTSTSRSKNLSNGKEGREGSPVREFYASFASAELEAWEAYERTTKVTFPRDKQGGWTFPTQWPPTKGDA